MQLKALVAILSVACTIGVQAAPNPLDRAAGVKGILRRSYSHGKDMSQVSKRAVALVAKKRDSNHRHHAAKHGKQCQPNTTPTTLAPEPQQSQTTPTPEQPQSTPIPEQPETTPTPEQPQSTPIPEQPQSTPTPEQPSSPAPEVTPSTDVGGNNNNNNNDNDNSGNGSTSLDSVSQQWLDEHNKARAQHGAPPMTWDSKLAAFAQSYARNCTFKHSGHGYGENLAAQTGSMTPADGVGPWMDEAKDYDPNNPVFSHFTQVVWKSSTQLGCALVSCGPEGLHKDDGSTLWPDPTASFGDNLYGVCEYYPPGNYDGEYAENVQK